KPAMASMPHEYAIVIEQRMQSSPEIPLSPQKSIQRRCFFNYHNYIMNIVQNRAFPSHPDMCRRLPPSGEGKASA
ncbi:MAG: hypothetical protein J5743_07390, partial [Victivallales bacterium]|nr:hypothetical protein [Victivallales bacterium]